MGQFARAGDMEPGVFLQRELKPHRTDYKLYLLLQPDLKFTTFTEVLLVCLQLKMPVLS